MARGALCAFGLVLAASVTGCLDFSDSRGAVMSIELCWDEQPGSGFVGANCVNTNRGTCRRAGVETMTWSLLKDGKDKVAGGTNQDCSNGIDVVDPRPGEYTLTISGKDSTGNQLWKDSCKGLDVLRFDVGYECDVDAPNAAPQSMNAQDAGVDGGSSAQ